MGVNTPETVKPDYPVEAWGPEASSFTRDFVASGRVRLQFDRERVDRYGRLLAYVWVDDRLLNEELVRAGLARFRAAISLRRTDEAPLSRSKDEARAAQRGIWSDVPTTTDSIDARNL